MFNDAPRLLLEKVEQVVKLIRSKGIGVYFCDGMISEGSPAKDLMDKIGGGIAFDPFSHIGAFLITALSVAAAGVLIYFIDRKILTKAGLSAEQAGSSALKLAVITAPYLYFFPSRLLYY